MTACVPATSIGALVLTGCVAVREKERTSWVGLFQGKPVFDATLSLIVAMLEQHMRVRTGQEGRSGLGGLKACSSIRECAESTHGKEWQTKREYGSTSENAQARLADKGKPDNSSRGTSEQAITARPRIKGHPRMLGSRSSSCGVWVLASSTW